MLQPLVDVTVVVSASVVVVLVLVVGPRYLLIASTARMVSTTDRFGGVALLAAEEGVVVGESFFGLEDGFFFFCTVGSFGRKRSDGSTGGRIV